MKGNLGLELLPMVSTCEPLTWWMGGAESYLFFFELFLCELLWYWSSLPVTATLPYYFYNSFALNKNKIFQGFHFSTLYAIIIYYYIYYYHNLNNNDNYLNPTTYITKKNQYFLFYLFSENTTRRPWHWITNRAKRTGSAIFKWISRDTDP